MARTTKTARAAAIIPQASTKQAQVIQLLQRPGGASLAELTSATAWLPHTTRAALTGLRKKGHAIERYQDDGVTRYRLPTAA